MKPFSRLSAFLVTLIAVSINTNFPTSPVNANESWVKIGTGESYNVFFVDSTSIQGNKRFRYFWKSVVFATPNTEVASRPAYSAVLYSSVDCKTFTYRDRIVVWYDQSQQVLDKFEYGERSKLRKAIPDTVGEGTLKFVCSSNRDVSDIKPIKGSGI